MSSAQVKSAAEPIGPGAPSGAGHENTSRSPALARLRDLALVPAIIAIAIVGYVINPVFLNSDNVINILQTMSEIGLLVLAETLILVAGRMDLSLESTFGLAPGVAAWLVVAPGITHG